MQAILNVSQNEVNADLLSLLKMLFKKDSVDEIVIKKTPIVFEEFDSHIPLENVIQSLKNESYSDAFIKDLENGLSKTVYKQ